MFKLLHIWLLCLSCCSLFAQPVSNSNNFDPNVEPVPMLTLDGHYYPEFLLGEKFYNYQVNYRISEKLMIDLQSFYSRFGTKERLRIPMLFKARISKNLYFLTGPELEYDLSGEVPGKEPRISINSGIEYRREDGLYINAIYNYQLNESNVGPQGGVGKSNIISVSSGLKF